MPHREQSPVELVVERRARDLWWYLRYLGSTTHEADDFTQESIAALMASNFEYRGDAETFAYLRTTARRIYADHCRKSARVRVHDELDVAESVWQEHDERASIQDRLAALQLCMRALDQRSRHLLDLQFRDKLDRDAIARRTGLSFLNVKAILQRAKATLRNCIARRIES